MNDQLRQWINNPLTGLFMEVVNKEIKRREFEILTLVQRSRIMDPEVQEFLVMLKGRIQILKEIIDMDNFITLEDLEEFNKDKEENKDVESTGT